MEFDAASDEAEPPRGPAGELLTKHRRLSYRDARPWLKRSSVVLGAMACGREIRWLRDDERHDYVQQLRHAEGQDCNVAGDVLLYRTSGGLTVLVVEEPY